MEKSPQKREGGHEHRRTIRQTCSSSFFRNSILLAIHLKLCVPRPFERFFASSVTLATVVLNLAISISSARACCSDCSAWYSSHSSVSKLAGEQSACYKIMQHCWGWRGTLEQRGRLAQHVDALTDEKVETIKQFSNAAYTTRS